VIEWRQVPWPLWMIFVSGVVGTILLEVKLHGQVPSRVLFPFVMFAWLFLLLKGVRWVWIATLGISILGFVPDVLSGSLRWQGVASGLATLVLLLLPTTRRYFSSNGARTAGPAR
jgi:hypothetical protein